MCVFCASRRRHTRYWRDWSSDVCSSDLADAFVLALRTLFDPAAGNLPSGEIELRLGDQSFAAAVRDGRFEVDRKSVVSGKSVDLGGRRILKKKTRTTRESR